jgi:peptide/nickel transport system permease protein
VNRSLQKKLLNYVLAAWGALTLNFILPRMMPGDPVEATLGRLKGRLTPEIEVAIRNAMGQAEGNILQQYWNYLTGIVVGDWGVSVVRFPEQVSTLVWNALGWTLLIAGTALVLSFVIGTFLGVL